MEEDASEEELKIKITLLLIHNFENRVWTARFDSRLRPFATAAR